MDAELQPTWKVQTRDCCNAELHCTVHEAWTWRVTCCNWRCSQHLFVVSSEWTWCETEGSSPWAQALVPGTVDTDTQKKVFDHKRTNLDYLWALCCMYYQTVVLIFSLSSWLQVLQFFFHDILIPVFIRLLRAFQSASHGEKRTKTCIVSYCINKWCVLIRLYYCAFWHHVNLLKSYSAAILITNSNFQDKGS